MLSVGRSSPSACGDVIGDAVRAGVEVHLGKVGEGIHVRHDAPRVRRVREVVEHAVHLVEVALGIVRLLRDLIAIRLADGTGLVGPLIPDMRVEIVDVVRFTLIDPENLIHRALERRAPQREGREFLAQVVTSGHPEVLDGVGRRPVFPMGPHFLPLGCGAVVQDIRAHPHEKLICLAHAHPYDSSKTSTLLYAMRSMSTKDALRGAISIGTRPDGAPRKHGRPLWSRPRAPSPEGLLRLRAHLSDRTRPQNR